MSKRTPSARIDQPGDGLDPTEMAAWRGFLAAYRRVVDRLSAELRDAEDLPLAWFDVLVQLSEADGHALRMLELADAVLLSKSGLSRLVDRMEAAGLVRRESCEGDARGVRAVLTEAGARRLQGAVPTHVRGVREHFVDVLDPDEAEVLATALERVATGPAGRARHG